MYCMATHGLSQDFESNKKNNFIALLSEKGGGGDEEEVKRRKEDTRAKEEDGDEEQNEKQMSFQEKNKENCIAPLRRSVPWDALPVMPIILFVRLLPFCLYISLG